MQNQNDDNASGIRLFKNPAGKRVKIQVFREEVFTNSGAFSTVFKGRISQLRDDGSRGPEIEVALKKQIVRDTKIYRELAILRALTVSYPHDNIVKLLYSQRNAHDMGEGNIHYTLIFHFVQQTLSEVKKQIFETRAVLDIKLYMWQIFAGLDHLRRHRIIHRDIKPVNMLIDSKTGKLQIADFGSAIYFPCHRHLNRNYAVTRPYRPPEMVLGSSLYTWMIDVWSAGCIFAELYLGNWLFYQSGQKEIEQLQYTYSILGVPSAADLQAMNVLDLSKFVPSNNPPNVICPLMELSQKFAQTPFSKKDWDPAVKLIEQILQYDPTKRLHGRQLLMDPFFDELFEPGKRRANKILVAEALTVADRERIGGTPV